MFFTDPVRVPDPEAVCARLARGTCVVYRAFGADDAVARGLRLAAIARRRGLILLAGADPKLALAIGAHGVHLPERLAHRARRIRSARPGWIVTAAAHGLAAARRAARMGAHAVVVSPVFASASSSAGRPLGPLRLAAIARRVAAPVIGLGGISQKNAPRLKDTGLAGLAAVEALAASVLDQKFA